MTLTLMNTTPIVVKMMSHQMSSILRPIHLIQTGEKPLTELLTDIIIMMLSIVLILTYTGPGILYIQLQCIRCKS